jgi:hypothetical protein
MNYAQYLQHASNCGVTALPKYILHRSGLYDENFDGFSTSLTWESYLEVVRKYRAGGYEQTSIQKMVEELEAAIESTRKRAANLKNELKSIINP